MLKSFILVGIGGAVGSMLRYGTSLWLNPIKLGNFPYATLLANLFGCFLIGIFMGLWGKSIHSNFYQLTVIGFCGGYTTFSTFSYENLAMWQSGSYINLIIYMLLSIIGGLALVSLGYFLLIRL